MIAVLGVLAYVGARETSVFAVQTLDVRGGSPKTRAHVRAALEGEVGRSLLVVDRDTLAEKLSGLPDVLGSRTTVTSRTRSASPCGASSRCSCSARAPTRTWSPPPAGCSRDCRTRSSRLPRLWVTKDVPVSVGDALPPIESASVRALAVAERAGLPGGVRSIVQARGSFTLELGRGLELRLGQPGDLRLKLAIARRILRATGSTVDAAYLDVSVPERPVLSGDPQP